MGGDGWILLASTFRLREKSRSSGRPCFLLFPPRVSGGNLLLPAFRRGVACAPALSAGSPLEYRPMPVEGSTVSYFGGFGARVWLRAWSPLHFAPTRVSRVTHRRQPRRCRTGQGSACGGGRGRISGLLRRSPAARSGPAGTRGHRSCAPGFVFAGQPRPGGLKRRPYPCAFHSGGAPDGVG